MPDKIQKHFIQRLSEVNEFIEVPEYKSGTIEASVEILKEVGLERTHLFPDPDGKITICSTQNGLQLYLEVKYQNEIFFRLKECSGDLIKEHFAINIETVLEEINKNFKI